MKLLLDENLPKKLKLDFPLHEVYTVRDMKWNGIKNGALLALMLQNGFEALLSFDQNIPHQQNFATYPITVFVFIAPANTYPVLQPLCAEVNKHLAAEDIQKGVIYIMNEVGIPEIVMIENYRTGLLWKLFMSIPEIQGGLQKLGFESAGVK